MVDEDAILALNAAHEVETSPLDRSRLRSLLAEAFHLGLKGQNGCEAFLIAFDQNANYDSPNFRWFQRRFDDFVYVDRVIVAKAQQGRGLARSLYEELFTRAALEGHQRVVCEVNEQPPNPASDAFHQALGFEVAGRAELADRGKVVRYLVKDLNLPYRT